MADINEAVQKSERARILDIWEFPHDSMCMLVEMRQRVITQFGTRSGYGTEVSDEPVPAYYTGYVQTTLTHNDLCSDGGYIDRVEVHGGVTYGPDNAGWVGFDTNHAYDMNADEDGEPLPGCSNWRYRNDHGRVISPDYVRSEIESLAEQLHSLESGRSRGDGSGEGADG